MVLREDAVVMMAIAFVDFSCFPAVFALMALDDALDGHCGWIAVIAGRVPLIH